jgi:hypothetical protein
MRGILAVVIERKQKCSLGEIEFTIMMNMRVGEHPKN